MMVLCNPALHQANGLDASTVPGVSTMPGASGIGDQRTSASVTMELMAKQNRQREAKEQAEAAQRRRTEALRAAEQAEAEYLRACEAERLAFQDGQSGMPSCWLGFMIKIWSIIL